MRTRCLGALVLFAMSAAGCVRPVQEPATRWRFTDQAMRVVKDPILRADMIQALDAADQAGTDPSISKFRVRVATVVEARGVKRIVVGGNSEYALPEAIHGETSAINHAIAQVGPAATRSTLQFLAFYSERCDGGGSCGDCRDYILQTTRAADLLMACGQSTDHSVHVQHFAEQIVAESSLPVTEEPVQGVSVEELDGLAGLAVAAVARGVSLFTPPERRSAAAVLSHGGARYVAAGADDAAFHYRFPIGGALQQAASVGDYFMKTVVIAGESGRLPVVSYRDRQYGYEFSSFNKTKGLPPIRVVLVEGARGERRRATTFEALLPGAFSAADFMPDAVGRFLEGK